MKSTRKQRVFCEDISPTYNSIKREKHNGKQLILRGVSYTRIGDDMMLNHNTNKIEKYET